MSDEHNDANLVKPTPDEIRAQAEAEVDALVGRAQEALTAFEALNQ